jgi:hypothetical protein
MMVEALWRNLKRITLYLFSRPRLDHCSYAIITKSLAHYRNVLSILTRPVNPARPPALTNSQQEFKKSFVHLASIPIKGQYTTDVAQWVCDCGSQKYHAHLLCKHLVQAAGKIPDAWWHTARRYHVRPFYTLPVNGAAASDPPEDVESAHFWVPCMSTRSLGSATVTINPASTSSSLPNADAPRTTPASTNAVPRHSIVHSAASTTPAPVAARTAALRVASAQPIPGSSRTRTPPPRTHALGRSLNPIVIDDSDDDDDMIEQAALSPVASAVKGEDDDDDVFIPDEDEDDFSSSHRSSSVRRELCIAQSCCANILYLDLFFSRQTGSHGTRRTASRADRGWLGLHA